jgi:hypothetical protein
MATGQEGAIVWMMVSPPKSMLKATAQSNSTKRYGWCVVISDAGSFLTSGISTHTEGLSV